MRDLSPARRSQETAGKEDDRAVTTAEELIQLTTATVSEALGRMPSIDGAIGPVWGPASVAGPAFTVEAAPGDLLALHHAVEQAPKGSVLVVATHETDAAVWGDFIGQDAKLRGIAGLVTDGRVRDAAGLRRLGFPTFARGVTPRAGTEQEPGRLQVPVTLCGVTVSPGDWVVADDDGVVIVPASRLDDVLCFGRERLEREPRLRRELEQGTPTLDALGLRPTPG